jgi:hypothetical protein
MSGGHFDGIPFQLAGLPEEILALAEHHCQSREAHEAFVKAAQLIREAMVYLHRIDYFVEGDDGETTFLT